MPKIIRFHEFGDPMVLKVEEVEPGSPKEDEVLLKVDCIAVNQAESLMRQKRYFEVPKVFPSRLGYDCAGTVIAVGNAVSAQLIGKQVLTLPCFSQISHGIYGQWAIVPASAVMEYPTSLSSEIACTIGVPYSTAYFGLFEMAALATGQTVLITAASSSTALAAMQLSKSIAARVIVTTRRKAKAEALLKLGADEVIATQEEDIEARIKQLTNGKGVDAVYDAVGGSGFSKFGGIVAPFAKIISYGFLESPDLTFNGLGLYRKGASVHFYQVFHFTGQPSINLPPRVEAVGRAKQFLKKSMDAGFIKPTIDRSFQLDDIVEAHRHLESGERIGKIVVHAS